MKFRVNYLVIPTISLLVGVLGNYYAMSGVSFYATLNKPELTPPNWSFYLAWLVIFTLTTASALIFWNKESGERKFLWFTFKKHFDNYDWLIIGLFFLNAILNILWSYLFFSLQSFSGAFIEILFLELTILLLIILLWPVSRLASLLLLPYFIWVAFASYLTYLFPGVQTTCC